MDAADGQKPTKRGLCGLPDPTMSLVLVAVLLARLALWVHADLWYDEVVTLVDFAMGGPDGRLAHVFRHYPIANNHILFSAVAWLWLRLTGFSLAETMLRLPAILFAVLAVLAAFRQWRSSLGHRVALFAALVLAVSPALSPFHYQFRGYSLSFLLAVPATAGAWEMARGRVRQGAWLAGFSCFLLPLVIPSNLPLVAALALFVLIAGTGRFGRRLVVAVAYGLPGLLGGLYYLTIWPQFLRVMQQTSGWTSGWRVAWHLALALVAHATPVFVVMAVGLLPRSGSGDGTSRERREALAMGAACSLAVVGSILSSRTAPFPRVFAVFFVPLTWAAFHFCRHAAFWHGRRTLQAVGAILISAFLWERGAELLTQRQLARGEFPQNLLQQYYRGDDGLSRVMGELERRELGERIVLLANAYDFPTANFYWRLSGLPSDEVGPRRVISVADDRRVEDCRRALRHGLALVAVAVSEREAVRMFGECGQTGRIEGMFPVGHRRLYVLHPPAAVRRLPVPPGAGL